MKQAAGAAGRSCSTACSSGTCDFTCRNCSGSSSRRGVPSGGLSGSSGVASSGGSRGSDRVHAAEGLDVLAAVQEAPPEVLVVLFEPLNQVIITGGNDGLVKVGDLLAGSGLAYARGGGRSGLLAQCLSANSC